MTNCSHLLFTGAEDTTQCNSIIHSESYIASPGYPHSYPSLTSCIYRIIVSKMLDKFNT